MYSSALHSQFNYWVLTFMSETILVGRSLTEIVKLYSQNQCNTVQCYKIYANTGFPINDQGRIQILLVKSHYRPTL